MVWDNDSVIQLIEAYKRKEILWKPRNRNYHNRLLKKNAWDQLEIELQRPLDEIKRKMDYLLMALRRERQKIAKSLTDPGADNVHQPTWFAFAHLEFLLDRNKLEAGRISTENEGKKITVDIYPVKNEPSEDESNDSQSQSSESEEPGTQADSWLEGQDSTEASGGQECAIQEFGKQASRDRVSDIQAPGSQSSENRAPGTRPKSAAFISPVPKKQKKCPPQNDPLMNEATSAVSTPFSDHHQIYANYLASKFRSYTRTTFLTVEHRINEILYNADRGQYET